MSEGKMRAPLFLEPGQGRSYDMGRIQAVFKANRGAVRAGVLNVSVPGAFEEAMPGIVAWFAEHPPGDTR